MRGGSLLGQPQPIAGDFADTIESVNRSAITSLRRRWSDEDVDNLRAQLLDQSRIVKPPHTLVSPWAGTDDGLVDVRGLSAGSGGLDIRYLMLEGIDLSFARGAISVFESELSDCRFDFVALTGQSRFSQGSIRKFRGDRRSPPVRSASASARRVSEVTVDGYDHGSLRRAGRTRARPGNPSGGSGDGFAAVECRSLTTATLGGDMRRPRRPHNSGDRRGR